MIKLLTSTRFIGLLLAFLTFIVLVFATEYKPMELSEAISIIYGIYVAGRTIRGSKTEKSLTPN